MYFSLKYHRERIMLIKSNTENNLAKAMNKISLPKKPQSYNLCVKADALRFAKLYKESVKVYLDAIMQDRNCVEAYSGIVESYKYLQEYSKAIKILEKLLIIDDSNDKYYYELGVCYLSCGKPEEIGRAHV